VSQYDLYRFITQIADAKVLNTDSRSGKRSGNEHHY